MTFTQFASVKERSVSETPHVCIVRLHLLY